MTRMHILCTGGGSMGHVLPCLAVMEVVKKKRPDIRVTFVTSLRSNERRILRQEGYDVHAIHAPKSPRSISLQWFWFPVLFSIACIESFLLLMKDRPSLVFSKGGFVSVPVCLMSWTLRIPIVLHESDSIMGMGNRFIATLARAVCTGFPLHHLGAIHTGNPVRSFLAGASKEEGRHITGFTGNRPVLLVIGGSQGAQAINKAIAENITPLLMRADIIHLTGEGKAGADLHDSGYWTAHSVTTELPHLYALADLVVTRAGAGTLSELAFLQKPAVVIPLEGVAHNHQVQNAEMLQKQNAVDLFQQSSLKNLPQHVASLLADHLRLQQLGKNLHAAFPEGAAENIACVLLDTLKADA